MAKLCLKVSSFILIDKYGNERNIALLVYLKAIDFWLRRRNEEMDLFFTEEKTIKTNTQK